MAIEGRPEKADMRHDPLRQRQLIEMILCVRRKDVGVLVTAWGCVLQDRYVVQHVLNPRLDLRGPPSKLQRAPRRVVDGTLVGKVARRNGEAREPPARRRITNEILRSNAPVERENLEVRGRVNVRFPHGASDGAMRLRER